MQKRAVWIPVEGGHSSQTFNVVYDDAWGRFRWSRRQPKPATNGRSMLLAPVYLKHRFKEIDVGVTRACSY